MKNRIIICDESDIIVEGLKKIAESIKLSVVAHIRRHEQLSEKIRQSDAQIAIINQAVLGQFKNSYIQDLHREFPNLEVITLTSTYSDRKPSLLNENNISLNDSREEIEALLLKVTDNKNDPSSGEALSKREKDVLIAVAKGMMNKEISEELNISIHTVITHRKNITKKTGIKSVSGLTVYALLNNLIDEGDVKK